jgi:Protein of unknown function (DUF4231)
MAFIQVCTRENKQIGLLREAIQVTTLTEEQKRTVSYRYLSLIDEYSGRVTRYSVSFNTLRIVITVGSLIVPALLSVQYTAGNVSSSDATMSAQMYWLVWNLSLFVTISNGIMALLKVDKKYFVLNTTYQHLLSEGWQFIHLSGKYSGFYTPSAAASHENQFIYFCNMVEKIRMRQVEEEYYKIDQAHSHGNSSSGGQAQDQLIPPTPAKATIKSSAILPFGDIGEKSPIIVNDESEDTEKIFIAPLGGGPSSSRGPTVSSAQEATVRKKQHPQNSS